MISTTDMQTAKSHTATLQAQETYAELIHRLTRTNVFSANAVDNNLANSIANKFFNCSSVYSHVLYLPSRTCFRFAKPTMVVPLFVSGDTVIVNNKHTIVKCTNDSIFYNNGLGVVNTGAPSCLLVSQ